MAKQPSKGAARPKGEAQRKRSGVAAATEALVRPAMEELGLRLWDVRYEKEGPEWYLRVFIERDTPMDTDTCEAASRAIDPLLDAANLIEESYYLEVGSPGLGRKLTRPEHFAVLMGQKVEARLYHPDEEGRKEMTGILRDLQDGIVLLVEPDSEKEIRVVLKDAATFKLCDDEDLFS